MFVVVVSFLRELWGLAEVSNVGSCVAPYLLSWYGDERIEKRLVVGETRDW